MSALPAKHLFTAEDFAVMTDSGLFADDDRIELLRGEIFEMSPVGQRHAACVRRLTNLLARRLGESAVVDAQNPLRLNELSQPQPDLVVLQPRDDFYADAHPGPEDVLVLIEVADSSLAYDRDLKIPLYARSAVPEVWLVDLEAQAVEIYRDPGPDGYRVNERITEPTAELRSTNLPRLALRLEAVLG